jgi:hypothetical protein
VVSLHRLTAAAAPLNRKREVDADWQCCGRLCRNCAIALPLAVSRHRMCITVHPVALAKETKRNIESGLPDW